jgi:hypothetical protein
MARFLHCVSAISTYDAPRNSESDDILAEILGITFGFFSIHLTKWHINAAPILCEVRSELGQGDSDPSVQGSLSYAQF